MKLLNWINRKSIKIKQLEQELQLLKEKHKIIYEERLELIENPSSEKSLNIKFNHIMKKSLFQMMMFGSTTINYNKGIGLGLAEQISKSK